MYSIQDCLSGNEDIIHSYGAEFGFLDTFYLRRGYYQDKAGHITGKTSGYGINLHYKNTVSFGYNYAEMPGGELGGPQVSVDTSSSKLKQSKNYSINLDLIRVFDLSVSLYNYLKLIKTAKSH